MANRSPVEWDVPGKVSGRLPHGESGTAPIKTRQNRPAVQGMSGAARGGRRSQRRPPMGYSGVLRVQSRDHGGRSYRGPCPRR